MNTKALVAEFIGTFALIFIGAGAGAVSDNIVAVGLAHGLVIVAFAYGYGHISGLYFNPAVTIALLAGGQIKLNDAIGYVVIQLLGGIVGAFVLLAVLGDGTSLGVTQLADGISAWQGLLLETVLTFFLVNIIYNTAVSGKAGDMAPIAIGMTLAFAIFMGGNVTGASLNPARTLGPAIATGDFANIWLYLVGPLIGGVLAALLYQNVLKSNK